ncbi:MAG: PD-(D/E)XK nuclease family protein [Acidobacteria bacterium]|nr:PD-(D/E)XK nuclease family protein [Acidobacteriota bacterium]
MITPRFTRLVRVPDYKAMRAAIARLAPAADLAARRTAVLVPTRGAAEELRRSLETRGLGAESRAVFLPDLVTRTEFYRRLHAALPDAPALLTDPEREVLLRRAAREVAAAGILPPFRLRPGLILQMLDFYDELRRREQTLDHFERLATGRLASSADIDRGAERLLRQTEFLCAAFAAFERGTVETGCIDEHGLRAILLDPALPTQRAYEQVVVTLADQAADPRGLYASDFDLLTRMGGLTRIDVVATERLLASGFHERIHNLLPGIVEEKRAERGILPTLVAPETSDPEQRWFLHRDREDELAQFVRWLKHRAGSPFPAVQLPALDRIGVVFQRPLPYLYLARQVFVDGDVPYQALDALPLSAEPFAATIDVLFSFLISEGNRSSTGELLGSPHLSLGTGRPEASDGSAPAAESAAQAMAALRPVLTSPAASAQIDAFLSFLHRFERLPAHGDEWAGRHLRARAAILAALETLRDAHARHDDEPLEIVELAGSVRRWIESQTFSPRTGLEGIRLLDAASAPYSDLDEIRIVGLVDRDWPEPGNRSIFYPMSILSNLGWPVDAARMAAARARFHDLLTAPGLRVSASVFTLEDDAIVAGSPFLEEIGTAGLPLERWPAPPEGRAFAHEWADAGIPTEEGSAAEWLTLRRARTAASDSRFKGSTGARTPRTYAISYLERYLECPFKYLAAQVLKLPEERDEESGLTPMERGHFIHEVFEEFFVTWQGAGRGTITTANVADALELFEVIAERLLDALPAADRALERTHLLGSAAASGLAERAFAFEIEQGGEVVERLLEHVLEGEFTFAGRDGPRKVHIKAKADRIDLMADGSLRIIDYKLGKAPKPSRALQLPIYGVIAQQELNGHRGRSWTVNSAGYVAFKEKEAFVPLGGKAVALGEAIAEGQARMLAAIDGIERGEFPVQPDEPFRCQWCGYAGVCRKDYVGDE